MITIYQSHLDKFLIIKEISNENNFKSYVTSNTIYPNANNLTGCLTFYEIKIKNLKVNANDETVKI